MEARLNAGLIDAQLKLAARDPEAARAWILERGLEPFARGLVEALQPKRACAECGQRRHNVWAFRTFAKIAKLIESTPAVMIAVVQELGVRDMPELKRLVTGAKSVAEMPEEARAELMERALLDIYSRRPELAARSLLARK